MTAPYTALDLGDANLAGVVFRPQRDFVAIEAVALEAGLWACQIDLATCSTKPAVLDRLGVALRFPEYFGGNWDALADALSDLSWLDATGYVLLLRNVAEFHESEVEFAVLLSILEEAAVDWREEGVPFWVFVEEPENA